MKDSHDKSVRIADITTLIKTLFFGILVSEAWYFSKIVAGAINSFINRFNYEETAIYVSLMCLLAVCLYLFLYRNSVQEIKKILKSNRIDIFVIFVSGILLSLSFDGIGTRKYETIVSLLKIGQLLLLTALPIVFGLALMLRAFILYTKKHKKQSSFFISDRERETRSEDLLDLSEKASRFAERVYNVGSTESMVFGIDAPWGIGKSSFVNFCGEYWNEKFKERVIVYNFNPLRYENRDNLLEKFIDGLVRTIQKHSFIPEIRPLASRYSRFISGAKGMFSFLGFDFEMTPGGYTVDDAFDDLEIAISSLDKKIIIVIDDLDRLHFSAIKDVLFVVKKSFTLPNLSYVICYDTDNINALENGSSKTEKVMEFFEKFINVKISLYPDSQLLEKYISENLPRVLVNSSADPLLIAKALGGLIDIYRSDDYHKYLPFIGDIRKIKRLINASLLFEIEKTDFDNNDFDKRDLINLLLIYINYPNIFRKIYDSETHGKRGFFSVLSPFDENYPRENGAVLSDEKDYKNSNDYIDYVKNLTPGQQFLLDAVFNVKEKLKKTSIDSITPDMRSSYACFNGGGLLEGARNLEEYLNLIVNLSKPQKEKQHKFYVNCKDELLKGVSIADILSRGEFSFSKDEKNHELFWKVVINSLIEFDSAIGEKLIDHVVDIIPTHSLLSCEGVSLGFRSDLTLFLTRLLDQVGWSDEKQKHRNNSEENITSIANRIFGEGSYSNKGLVKILGNTSRGISGLYDLLSFRLFCSADRGGQSYNLQTALSKHGDKNAPTTGSVATIAIEEMREISQKVFFLFKAQYIDQKKNIFDLIDGLSLAELTGKYEEFVNGGVANGSIKDLEGDILKIKSKMKSFIPYQLGNELVSMGVGCGYYDLTGKEDKRKIRNEMNMYLFGQCFNPTVNQRNYEHFLNYLLISFASTFDEDERWVPSINEFTNVLKKESLKEYWEKNKDAIEKLKFTEKDTNVVALNYTANYKKHLPRVFKVLDQLLGESTK